MKRSSSYANILAILAGSFLGSLAFQGIWSSEGLASSKRGRKVEVLRVREVVFVDDDGTERGSIGVMAKDVGQGCGLVLKDARGRERLKLGNAAEGHWGLTVQDEAGKYVSAFGVDPQQSGLYFADSQDGLHLSMGVEKGGCASGFGITDSRGHDLLGLGVGAEGTGISLRDAEGRERGGIGMIPSGETAFVLKGDKGEELWRAP